MWYGSRPRPRRLCVRWRRSYSQEKRHTHPTQFLAHAYCGQMAGWMKTPLGMEVDLDTGHIVLDVVPAVRELGHSSPLFSPMSNVATVVHISYCSTPVLICIIMLSSGKTRHRTQKRSKLQYTLLMPSSLGSPSNKFYTSIQ